MAKKNQNIKQKQYCSKFNKHFKNSPYFKKILKKKKKRRTGHGVMRGQRRQRSRLVERPYEGDDGQGSPLQKARARARDQVELEI